MRTPIKTISAIVATVGLAVLPTPAHASDWGGVIDPAGCSGDTVASAPFTDWQGRTVGQLQLRWSDACNVQWARITAFGEAGHLAATVKEVSYPNNQAGTDEYQVGEAWTRGIILNGGPQSAACAYGDLYNGPSYVHVSAVACA